VTSILKTAGLVNALDRPQAYAGTVSGALAQWRGRESGFWELAMLQANPTGLVVSTLLLPQALRCFVCPEWKKFGPSPVTCRPSRSS
jgi:hypothetical protein